MEVVTAIVANIAEYVVVPVRRWLCYSFQYGGNIENLKNRVEELQGARERVQHAVTAALYKCEEIETDVEGWLTKVNKITEEAREVLAGAEDAKLKSCNGKCLNLKPRHILSQKANKITQEIAEDKILEKGRFDKVSYRPTSQGMEAMPRSDYLSFESRESTMAQLMEALKDASVNVIGVWGMGGVGKTTLVTEVGRQAKEEKLFDEVAMVDVTPNPDTRQIQGEIADVLGLNFHVEAKRERAKYLRQKLSKDKKILLVLDNIWETLDLEEIGIPHKECKVVMISRDRYILSQMDSQERFELQALTREEAWNLFANMAGDVVQGPEFLDTATKIVQKCAGLPIALVTVSKALKSRRLLYEWKDALRRLERPAPRNLRNMESTIYNCIELSYSHLESQEDKEFFLHCAEWPHCVFYADMLRYCYGLGLFSGINTLEEGRNNIYTLIQRLKDAALLQDCQMLHCPLKMEHCHIHDVVRYVAKLIASLNHYIIFLGDGDNEKEWPDVDLLKRYKAFYIRGGDIPELSNEMEFSKLKFFYVNRRGNSLQIPESFFCRMRKLKVLDVTGAQLSSIPLSLPLLTNLRTLCLDHCVLEDVAIIGNLKNLAILSLINSNILELPQEIGMLTRLQLLDLSGCSKLKVIPPNVLSSLVELEELFMGGTSIQWEVEGVNSKRRNASLVELNHLSQLVTLEIHIQDTNSLPKDLSFKKLERYKIFIGDVWDWSNEDVSLRTLKLKMNIGTQLQIGIRKLLKRIENLCLDKLKGVNSVLQELDWEGFQHLKYLQIQNNPEIKYIINSRMLVIAFPTLETLILRNMMNLEEICHSRLALTSFHNLRTIKVQHCGSLKFFISSSMVNDLSLLEELEIKECNNMATIVMKEKSEIESEHTTWFPKLRCLILHHLPKLMGFLSIKTSFTTDVGETILESKLDCYTQILQEEVVFPKLEKLELSSIHWEDVWHKKQHATFSCKFTSMPTTSSLQNLLSLIVCGSGNIKHLLSFSKIKSMVQLKCLEIRECNVMEEILLTEDLALEEEAIAKTLFSQIETLYMIDLPFLKWFCKESNIKFLSLEKLVIRGCPKFMTFICRLDSLSMTAGKEFNDISADKSSYAVMEPLFNEMVVFPKLKKLMISHIVDLKKIWHNQFVEKSFYEVQLLRIESCENLTNVFQSHMLERFQSLKHLDICDCDSLQEVFELHGLDAKETPAITAIQLQKLVLIGLPKLKHVWNKDPYPIFTFQDLQEVYVRGCECLESLFTASIGKSLMQLEILSIAHCAVKEIVAGEDITQEIERLVFPRVTHLALRSLPRLEQFHLGVYTTKWPRLKKIWVQGCSFDLTLSSFEEALEESQHETSNKQLHFLIDKSQAKCIDSIEEFAEDINNSVIKWEA